MEPLKLNSTSSNLTYAGKYFARPFEILVPSRFSNHRLSLQILHGGYKLKQLSVVIYRCPVLSIEVNVRAKISNHI